MPDFADAKEWRIYKRRERYRAHELSTGLGWEVLSPDGERKVYTPEDFHRRFELGANTGKAVGAKGTVYYS